MYYKLIVDNNPDLAVKSYKPMDVNEMYVLFCNFVSNASSKETKN